MINQFKFIIRSTTTNILIDSPDFPDIPDSYDSMDSIVETVPKRKRTSSSSGDIKCFVDEFKGTQSRKLELLEKIIETPEKSELELFFASICKTVQKFTPLEQAKIKMKITETVNVAEIKHLETREFVYIIDNDINVSTTSFDANNLNGNFNTAEENEMNILC